jgi:N-acetylmuramoyl-L-alanine amidase
VRQITHIIIHCSASDWGCAREIDAWHKARGWDGIGYHNVIQNGRPEPGVHLLSLEGQIECGRRIDETGAHCIGYNESSIGICLIGNGPGTFVLEQFDALKHLLIDLCVTYRIRPENILGHRETASGKAEGKTCPNFDVEALRKWMKGRQL